MRILAAVVTAVFAIPAWAQNAVPVTVNNFPRAESDLYMGNAVKDGGFGKFHNNRTPTEIDKQIVIRMNREHALTRSLLHTDTVDMNGRRAGREAAVPHTRPSALRAARSAGLLARRNRSVWLIRSRPSVVTITGPLCCVTLVRGTASGRPGQAPKARSGRRAAWKPLCAKRWASGYVSANAPAAFSSSHIASNTA